MLICFDLVDLRNFMYRAQSRGMTSSEYSYIYYAYMPHAEEETPWIHEDITADDIQKREAFYAMKRVSLAKHLTAHFSKNT